jgi:hypothetical protein
METAGKRLTASVMDRAELHHGETTIQSSGYWMDIRKIGSLCEASGHEEFDAGLSSTYIDAVSP